MTVKIIENYNPNDLRTNGEEYLLNSFKDSPLFEGWTIFEQPHINSMKPDFILTHPDKGIIIIEVKDWNLNLDVYEENGYVRGTNGKAINKNPVKQVEYYKENILHYQLKSSVNLSENFSLYNSSIETAVYFHYANKDEANNFCNNSNHNTRIWVKEDVQYLMNNSNHLNPKDFTYALSRKQSVFTKNNLLKNLVDELNLQLYYADYNNERRQPFVLTGEQRKLAQLNPGSIRRWSGVPGSGKSIIVAEKAVRAAKEGNNVLILTFNITLRHYLRDLCSQQFGQSNSKNDRKKLKTNITISHFHDFLKLILAEHELKIDFKNKNGTENLEDVYMNTVNEYFSYHPIIEHLHFDYILIDEGQDFKGDWIRFLKKFYTGVGELFIVYDKSQDLYEHGIWIEDSNQNWDIGFRGKPGHLKYTHRLPGDIVNKISLIREKLHVESDEILVDKQYQKDFFQHTLWYNYHPNNLQEKLKQIESHFHQLSKDNQIEDITILTTNENSGVAIVRYLKQLGIKISHVYDLESKKNIKRRRNEKWKFQGGTGRLKVSSYHSFKGWQTPNVLLILDAPNTRYNQNEIIMGETPVQALEKALFLSLSRIKERSDNGQYNFICLNYLVEYNYLSELFENYSDRNLPF